MSRNSKHVAVHLGIWTVVMNKTNFVSGWMAEFPRVCERFLVVTGSLFASLRPKEIFGFSKNDEKSGVESSTIFPELRTIGYLYTFMKEIYSIGPAYFVVEVLISLWKMAHWTLELYYSNRLLSAITQGLQSGRMNPSLIMQALVYNILVSVLSETIYHVGSNCTVVLRERVKFHFLEKAMHSALSFDVSTSEDPEVRGKLGEFGSNLVHLRYGAWEAFSGIMEMLTHLITILSQLSLMVGLARSSSAFMSSALPGIIHPFLTGFHRSLFNKSFVAFCNNPHFLRLVQLYHLAFSGEYQEDRANNNLGQYIEREFRRSRRLLGDVSSESPYLQFRPGFFSVLSGHTLDSSSIIFALRVLWDPNGVSLEDFVLIQQTSSVVLSITYQLLYNVRKTSEHFHTIKNIYSLAEVENKIKDGGVPYPLYSEDGSHSGAELEFRSVSFRYPGADKNALSDLSFRIKAGQLVVIVGVNGSGKTSTVKLLSRLYDPTGGEILLDGRPLTTYRIEDVRRATAILRQYHPILPVSLRENVALGCAERNATDDEIEKAMSEGGASRFVHKLKQGMDTVLSPVKTVIVNFVGKPDPDLKAVVGEKEVATNLSGGEMQRLSASRIFMRLMGGNIRLLVADEPTSALDPEGEHDLFKRLREHSGGKTVIFITHRFGHLTKYADLILCLKDGHLVEQGSHQELVDAGGEYKRLYDLQAKAFSA